MENTIEMRKCVSEILTGKLTSTKKYIELDCGGLVNQKCALNIFITLCKLLNKPELSDSFCKVDFYDIAVVCCKNILSLTEAETDNFLRALYHVMKYFLDQDLLMNVMNLSDFIIPPWMQNNRIEDVPLFGHFMVLVHNEIILKCSRKLNASSGIKFLSLSLRLQSILDNNSKKPSGLPKRITSYVSIFKTYESTDEQCHEFVVELLTFLKNMKSNQEKKDVFSAYLVLISLIVGKYDFKKPKMDNVKCLTQMFKTMKESFVADTTALCCVEIIENLLKILMTFYTKVDPKTSDILKDINNKLSMCLKKNYNNEMVLNTNYHICGIFGALFDYCQKNDRYSCFTMFEPSVQEELLKLFFIVGNSLILKKSVIKCCKQCSVTNDVAQAISILSYSANLLNNSLKSEITEFETRSKLAMKCLKLSCTYLKKLKDANCKKLNYNWQNVGTKIYNMGCRFYKNKSYAIAKEYYYLFAKTMISLEEFVSSDFGFDKPLGTCLSIYASCCSNLNHRREALTYYAVAMLVCENTRKKALQSWAVVKSNEGPGENLAQITVNHILFNDREIIYDLYPMYKYDKNIAEELLFCEIQHYAAKWPSRVPILNAYKELCEISEDPIIRIKAVNLIWEKIICLKDEEFAKQLEETKDLLIKRTDIKGSELNLHLSIVYYIEYYVKSYQIFNKNMADMCAASVPVSVAISDVPNEMNPFTDDKCDIVPTYQNLKVENKIKLLKNLNRCTTLWLQVLENELTDDIKIIVDDLKIETVIKQVAFEYRLQCHQYEMLKTWFLYYQFGKIFDKKIVIVTSIGFILECSDCNSMAMRSLEMEAEVLIEDLININTNQSFDTVVTYYINKSTGYFRCNKINEGLEILHLAEKYLDKTNSKTTQGRLLSLRSRYLNIPCSKNIIDHNENFLFLAQEAFGVIAEFYKEGGNKCPYNLSILFEISLLNSWTYYWLRMPREVRCYLKEPTILAQHLVLPIQTVQSVSLLAFTDLLDRHYDDCQVKLNGLKNILCLSSGSTCIKKAESCNLNVVSEVSKEFERLSLQTEARGLETVLDLQVPPSRKNMMGGSPVLPMEPFKLPPFVYHEVDCNCFYCSNLIYQIFVLETVHLEAQLSTNQSNDLNALDFYSGGLMFFEQILKKYNQPYKLNVKLPLPEINKDVILTQTLKILLQSYCRLLLNYSYFQLRQNKKVEAQNTVTKITELIGNENSMNMYLLDDVMRQQLNLLVLNLPVHNKPQTTDYHLEVRYDTSLSKTPDNKISKNKITITVSPQVQKAQPKKLVKALKFDLDSDDSDIEIPEAPIKQNKVLKIPSPYKTPAPAKIKIYTPASVKVKGNAKSVTKITSQVSDVPLIKKQLDTDEFLVSKRLEQRTKLLTEKLKSQKKNILKESNLDTDNILKNSPDIIEASFEDLNIKKTVSKKVTSTRENRLRTNLFNVNSGDLNAVKGKTINTRKTNVATSTKRVAVISQTNNVTPENISTRRSARNVKKR